MKKSNYSFHRVVVSQTDPLDSKKIKHSKEGRAERKQAKRVLRHHREGIKPPEESISPDITRRKTQKTD